MIPKKMLMNLNMGKYEIKASFLKESITTKFEVKNFNSDIEATIKISSISNNHFKINVETNFNENVKCDVTIFQTILNKIVGQFKHIS